MNCHDVTRLFDELEEKAEVWDPNAFVCKAFRNMGEKLAKARAGRPRHCSSDLFRQHLRANAAPSTPPETFVSRYGTGPRTPPDEYAASGWPPCDADIPPPPGMSPRTQELASLLAAGRRLDGLRDV